MARKEYYVSFEAKWEFKEDWENFNKIKKALENHGCYIDFKDGCLDIFLDHKTLSRGAGRRKILNSIGYEGDELVLVKLSDVLKMQETMSEKEIVSYLKMSRATYYRHLKIAKAKKAENEDYDPTF